MSRRLMTLTILAAGLPALAGAQSFRHGRIRYVEDGVTVQRAAEASAEEALPNMPFLPGDRVWTDHLGRVEFQFEGGSLVRLDNGSKLDYLSHDDERRGERIVLRLWSGSLYLHHRDRGSPEFEIETPGGLVGTRTRGVYRIDCESGETRLSVFEGEAFLEGNQEVRVAAGERVVARRGEIVEGPRAFDLTEGDRFADWVQDRHERLAFAGERPAYLPEEVASYADEFDTHGAWYYEAEVGHVWRPYVAAGWRPYWDGRWVWTIYGWTWVPREPWGWAAFHYGRWGYSPFIGWYWIPGRHWGPAWVSWRVGRDHLGWCPLGYRDRPVVVVRERGPRVRGHAVPRGSTRADQGRSAPRPDQGPGQGQGQDQQGGAWLYVSRSEIAAPTLPRVAQASPPETEWQAVDHTRARLSRDLTVSEGAWTPRTSRTKPTMGDTVPELRGQDPVATLPFSAQRVRGRDGRRYDSGSFGEAAMEPSKRTPSEAPDASADTSTRSGWRSSGSDSSSPRSAQPPTRGRDDGHMSAPQHQGSPSWGTPRRQREDGDAGRHRQEPPAVKQQEEREVMRPVFGGLSKPRHDDGGDRHAPPSGGSWGGSGRARDGGHRETAPAHQGGERARPAPPPAKADHPPQERKQAKEKEHN